MTYLVITQAQVASDYRDQAIENIKRVKHVALSNGANRVRLGLMHSGSNVGKLMVFQFFKSLDDAERVYDAVGEDPIYRETMQNSQFKITRRGVVKVHMEFGDYSFSGNLKYAALTIGTSDDPHLDAITNFANVLTSNGAVTAVYGSGFVGDMSDGKTHVFGETYSSLNSLQCAYDAAAEAGVAAELYKVVSVQRRQVLRLLD